MQLVRVVQDKDENENCKAEPILAFVVNAAGLGKTLRFACPRPLLHRSTSPNLR